jgi:metal-responsive CopG/Arc/MetJ family transcriptional regulator
MKNSALVTVSLPRAVLDQVDAAAQKERRTRSNFIRTALERSLTGADRLAALQEIAAAGLEEYAADHAPRERPANPAQIVAEASTEGQRMLDAHRAIAAGNRRATK